MSSASVLKSSFGLLDGKAATLVTLRCGKAEVVLTTLGATLLSMKVPDREDVAREVTLNHWDAPDVATLAARQREVGAYMGVTAGRFANRICQGKFTLDGQSYTLATNNGPNHLHGGDCGFDKRLWTLDDAGTATVQDEDGAEVKVARASMTLDSAAGEEGYPGALSARVTFSLRAVQAKADARELKQQQEEEQQHELRFDYSAESSAPTVVNLTNHTYWNLSGDLREDVARHQVGVCSVDPLDLLVLSFSFFILPPHGCCQTPSFCVCLFVWLYK